MLPDSLGLTKYFSDLSLEDNVVDMTEDHCHCSSSSLEGDCVPLDDAVKENQTGNLVVLSSVDRLCMNATFDESSTVALLLDSRYNNKETDTDEQTEEKERTRNYER